MRYDVGGITVGDEELCPIYGGAFNGWLVHACKSKCHQVAVNYTGSLPKDHAEYLTARRGTHYYANVVDAPVPIFRREVFVGVLDFLDEALGAGGRVGCHCNKGRSRAPAIVATYLAKRAKTIPSDSWDAAKAVMLERYPEFAPGLGIDTFLRAQWGTIS